MSEWWKSSSKECPVCESHKYTWERGCDNCGHYDEDGHKIKREKERRRKERRRDRRRRNNPYMG